MSSKARRILLSFRERADWTNVKRTAIAPPYIDNCRVLTQGPGRELFERYVEHVCKKRMPESGRGCRSLKDMALEVILQNMSGINNVDGWPAFLVRHVWEVVEKRCIQNFHCWKVLSKALRQESDATLGMLHYREIINRPKLELHDYTKPLTSNSFDFITCLSITVQFPVPDLVKLAKMTNLGILEIVNLENDDSVEVDGSSGVGDSLIRAWSREAKENKAFSVLRIMRLCNHFNVTHASIRYIHDFPALGIFDIRGCGIEDGLLAAEEVIEALRLGWTDNLDDEISKAVELECFLTSKRHATSAKPPKGLLWPRSRISRVERPVEPESATDLKTSNSIQSLASTNQSPSISHPGDSSGLEESVDTIVRGDDEWVSIDEELFHVMSGRVSGRASWIGEAWESQNSICWALLGDARQDSDLVRAGVKDMTKAARAGGHLISPLSVAHIRLGGTLPRRRREGSARRGLALIRLAVPTCTPPVVIPQQRGKAKEQKNSVRESKKRKLQGLLEDFHT